MVCVVDTNVGIAANEKSSASLTCVLTCVAALREVMTSGHIVIDDSWRIIGEYKRELLPDGQPGVGDLFLKWVLTNQWNPDRCTMVSITPKADDPEDFEEFPVHKGLTKFDRSDRKFVAVAAAHPAAPPILEATDSKWWGWKGALAECGIEVRFLCPAEIRQKYREKMG
ncbi:MAG: hypothetical protein HY900_35045, partial [Deltaproteobacteria bacterium]|nr:hypothetical protein [Deltaproteobacteria bacterium]